MSKQPGPLCQQCGLWQNKRNPIVEEFRDTRALPVGSPKVLFVLPRPLAQDDVTGYLLSDERTSWFLDFLQPLPLQFRITSLVRCWPGLKPNSTKDDDPKAANVKACTSTFLVDTLGEFVPDVIVALGTTALEWLWPTSRGKAPSIHKARTYPVQLDSGTWLLSSYDPMMHVHWLDSDGTNGKNLNEEYVRLMILICQVASGEFKPEDVVFRIISNQEEMNWLLSRMAHIPLDNPCCPDTETDVYIEGQNRKFRLNDPKIQEWEEKSGQQLPDKLTIWHPDSRLLLLGWTVWTGTEYETYCIFPDLVVSPDGQNYSPNLAMLLRGRYLLPFNGKSDFIDLWCKCRLWIFDPAWGIRWGDGFYMRQLRDQSALENSLKVTAQVLLSVPDWSIRIWQIMEEARAARMKRKEPDYMTMADIPLVQELCPYNANDTLQGLRVILEGGMDYPQLAYQWLCVFVWFFCTIERNGLPISISELTETIFRKENELEALYQKISVDPLVQRAEWLSGKEFNIRSPHFFNALIGYSENCYWDPTLGQQYTNGPVSGQFIFPDTIPHTPSSKKDCVRLASDKEVIAELAGETPGKKVPVENKTEGQLLWSGIRDWKRLGDDLLKYRLWLEYAVPGEDWDSDIWRIHPNFRLGKTERDDPDDVDGDQGGAKSGRTSAKPNTQNIKNEADFHRIIKAPRGKVLCFWDYARNELVWIGFNCKDKLYMEWARQGLDQHMENAAVIYSFRTGNSPDQFWAYKSREEILADPEGKCHPEQKIWREFGKTQNFAVAYLIGLYKFCEQNKCSLADGLAIMLLSQQLHPEVEAAKWRLYEQIQRGEMVTTYLLERRRSAVGWERDYTPPEVFFSPDPEINRKRSQHNFGIFRSLWNGWAGQTDGNDATSIMGALALKELESGNWLHPEKVKLNNYVHDSLWGEVDEDYVDVAVPAISEFMSQLWRLPKPFDLPIGVGAEVGTSYFDKKVWIPPAKRLALPA